MKRGFQFMLFLLVDREGKGGEDETLVLRALQKAPQAPNFRDTLR
jgi:hypothetical protein